MIRLDQNGRGDMTIQLQGSLPGLINENTPLWDWVGQLRLGIDPALIRFVDVTGTGENVFDVTLNRSTAMLEIRPFAVADYDWYAANGRSPTLELGFRFYMTDGTVQTSAGTYSVRVLDLDDTAPQALRFASGGKVEAGRSGAIIGTLAVTDPDTTSAFAYTIREDDQWLFEITSGVLKLRNDVSLTVTDGPSRSVVIDVSDGKQSAAFTLDFQVTLPGLADHTIDLFERHERRDGFYWANTSSLVGDHMLYEIASLHDQGSYKSLTMRDGDTLIFDQPEKIQLLDGAVYFSEDSKAAWVWSAYKTILGREPRHIEMGQAEMAVDKQLTRAEVARFLLETDEYQRNYANLNNQDFVKQLYINTSGNVSSAGVDYHARRLDAEQSRINTIESFIEYQKNIGLTAARADDGLFVPSFSMQQIDAILNVTSGYAPSSENMVWYNLLYSGYYSVLGLANMAITSDGYAAHMGKLSDRDFVTRLFTEAVGYAPDVPTVDWWTNVISAGIYTRPQYIEAVVTHLGPDSYVYERPDGVAFANPW